MVEHFTTPFGTIGALEGVCYELVNAGVIVELPLFELSMTIKTWILVVM